MNYRRFVKICYPNWVRLRNSERRQKLEELDLALNIIESRQLAAESEFGKELEFRQNLSKKVVLVAVKGPF